MRSPEEARIKKLEERNEDLRAAIEEANDHLADALDDANMYAKSDDVRPSAIRAFDRIQEAHVKLCQVDPTRESGNGGGCE